MIGEAQSNKYGPTRPRDVVIWVVVWCFWTANLIVLTGTGHVATAFLVAGIFVFLVGSAMIIRPAIFEWLHYLVESPYRKKPHDPGYEKWLKGAEARRKIRQWTIPPFMVFWGVLCIVKFSIDLF